MKPIPQSNLTILKITTAIILSLTLFFTFLYQQGYRFNISKSYPRGIYKSFSKKTIEHGDMLMFCPEDTPLMQTALKRGYVLRGYCKGGFYPLLKKVAALPGDRVEVNDYVYINGKKMQKSKLYKNDPNGNPLPRTKDSNLTVPKNYMFLLSDYHELSFDSRYLGVIGFHQVINHMKPIYLID